MRVLVVHNRYRSEQPSGEDLVVDQESAALAAFGHEVLRYERRSDDIDQLSALRRASIPAAVVWNPFAGRDVGRTLDEYRPDVVHTHNLFPLLSPAVLLACTRRRVPVVSTFHNFRQLCVSGNFYRSGSVCHDCVGRAPWAGVRHGCYRNSSLASAPIALASVVQRRTWQSVPSAYVFISDAERELFASLGLPPTRCFVKWHMVPAGSTSTAREDLVVFTGRLSEAKGVRLLMEAWDLYQATSATRSLRLAVAGSGELDDEVRSWAADRPSVDVLGLLSHQACATLLGRARAAVVPSAYPEMFGLVVAEAKVAGVAPIAPAHGSFPELIDDGVDGLLFPPGDGRALAEAITQVESAPAWFDGLGTAARRAARRQFDPAGNLRRLESIYRFAIEHPTWREPGDVPEADGQPHHRTTVVPPGRAASGAQR